MKSFDEIYKIYLSWKDAIFGSNPKRKRFALIFLAFLLLFIICYLFIEITTNVLPLYEKVKPAIPAGPSKAKTKSSPPLEVFKKGTYGILLAKFENNSESLNGEKNVIHETIAATLNARFSELNMRDVEIKKVSEDHIALLTNHNDARTLGKRYNADLVIWGTTTIAGIIPFVTVVEPNKNEYQNIKPEITILNNKLCHIELKDVRDIRLPALTDDIILLSAFVIGEKYAKNKEFSKSIKYYINAIPQNSEKFPNYSSYILCKIGYLYTLMAKSESAIYYYDKAIKSNPINAAAYCNRGLLYIYKDHPNFKKAINDFNMALKIDPKDSKYLYNRGVALAYMGKYNEAIKDFTAAIVINPNYWAAHSNRGSAHMILKNYKQGFLDYDSALKINPGDIIALSNRADNYLKLGQYEKSINDCNELIKYKPEWGYWNRAQVKYEIKKYVDAISDYTEVIKIEPNNLWAYLNRAVAYGKIKDYAKSIDDFKHIIEVDPNFSYAYANLGSYYQSVGDDVNALKNLNEAIKLNPNEDLPHMNIGEIYVKQGYYNKALAEFNKAIKLDKKYKCTYCNRGMLYYKMCRYSKALADFKKAVTLDSKYSETYYKMSIIYKELGQNEKSKKMYAAFERYATDAMIRKVSISKETKKDINALKCYEQN